jgi:hypothetical protein
MPGPPAFPDGGGGGPGGSGAVGGSAGRGAGPEPGRSDPPGAAGGPDGGAGGGPPDGGPGGTGGPVGSGGTGDGGRGGSATGGEGGGPGGGGGSGAGGGGPGAGEEGGGAGAGVGAAAWRTTHSRPLTTSAALRSAGSALGVTVAVTRALPCPDAGLSSSHGAATAIVQLQSRVVATCTVWRPPAAGTMVGIASDGVHRTSPGPPSSARDVPPQPPAASTASIVVSTRGESQVRTSVDVHTADQAHLCRTLRQATRRGHEHARRGCRSLAVQRHSVCRRRHRGWLPPSTRLFGTGASAFRALSRFARIGTVAGAAREASSHGRRKSDGR